jgi:hypothetical protein
MPCRAIDWLLANPRAVSGEEAHDESQVGAVAIFSKSFCFCRQFLLNADVNVVVYCCSDESANSFMLFDALR